MDFPGSSPEGHGWTVLQKLNEQKSMGLFCDVSVMVEGKIFLAHKNVLSACSGYFYAALSRNEQQPFLVLDTVCLEGFSHLLEFFYTYKIPSCHVQDFVQAAQVLQVSLPLSLQTGSIGHNSASLTTKEENGSSQADLVVVDFREAESIKTRSSMAEAMISSSMPSYSDIRRKYEPAVQLKDTTKQHKEHILLKDAIAAPSPGLFLSKSLSRNGRLGRACETRTDSCLSPRCAQESTTPGSPGTSSESMGDENIIMCDDARADSTSDSQNFSHLPGNDVRILGRVRVSKSESVMADMHIGSGWDARDRDERLHDSVHKCDRCELLLTYSDYISHQRDPGVSLLQCSFCEKQFSYSCQLSLHQSSHHANKFYQCDQCGKQLSSLKKLRDHVAYHSDARPHQCRLCDKAYKVKNDLTQHIRVKHAEASTGKPPLIQLCEFCGQAVKHYKSHKIFCSGIKKYKCDFCMQTFHRISELKRHTWTHTGELPYRCKICGKGCRHPSNLKKHIRTVHKEDMRVQINKEHASPRFSKDLRPQAKHSGQLLQQILSTTFSALQCASAASAGSPPLPLTSATASPVTLTYFSMSTLAQQQSQTADQLLSCNTISTTPDTTGPV